LYTSFLRRVTDALGSARPENGQFDGIPFAIAVLAHCVDCGNFAALRDWMSSKSREIAIAEY
jgi:hypothetical protein